MKIAIYSDLHLEFKDFELPSGEADVIVLAGDIHVGDAGIDWAMQQIPDKPVLYVLGNHEYYQHNLPALCESMQQKVKNSNIHVLENDAIIINGIRFLGCTFWTDYNLYQDVPFSTLYAMNALADYRAISTETGLLVPEDTIKLHNHSKAWLIEQLSDTEIPTVVITHHAPAKPSIDKRYIDDPLTPAFVSELDRLVAHSGARLWIHGHTHFACQYRLGNTDVICNARGYPGETVTGFDAGLVYELIS